jgi:hypothetical protein
LSCALVIKVSCALVIKVPKRCVAILIAIDLLGRSGVGSPQATPTFKSALVRPTFTVALVLDPSKTRQHALTVYCLACCMLTAAARCETRACCWRRPRARRVRRSLNRTGLECLDAWPRRRGAAHGGWGLVLRRRRRLGHTLIGLKPHVYAFFHELGSGKYHNIVAGVRSL